MKSRKIPCYPWVSRNGSALGGARGPRPGWTGGRWGRGAPPAVAAQQDAAWGAGGVVIFLGTHVGSFDAKKGRISVPAPFRTILAGIGAGSLVLRTPSHSPCIDIWPQPWFEAEVQKRIAGLDSFDPDYERQTRRLVARAQTMTPDAEGRGVLPRDLVERAGLAGDIAFTGRIRYFQIWDATRLAAALAADDAEDARAVAA